MVNRKNPCCTQLHVFSLQTVFSFLLFQVYPSLLFHLTHLLYYFHHCLLHVQHFLLSVHHLRLPVHHLPLLLLHIPHHSLQAYHVYLREQRHAHCSIQGDQQCHHAQ